MTESEHKEFAEFMCKKLVNSMLCFHILKLVEKDYRTGYDICKKLREKHEGITMSLIYLNLNKLEKQGYVSHKVVHDRIDRNEHVLTEKGKHLLKHLKSNIRKMVETLYE